MKRLTLSLGLVAAVALVGCDQLTGKGGTKTDVGGPVGMKTTSTNNGSSAAPSTGTLDTDEQKTLYALGLVMARNAAMFNLSPGDVEYVKRGFSDGVTGAKPEVELEQWGPKIQALAQSRVKERAAGEKQKGDAVITAAAGEPGAQKLPSGMVYKSITPGNGASPTAADTVKVNYEGKLSDGKVFDSSYKRNAPATFPLRGVIPCWTEGVAHMKVGEKAQLTCPSNLAYGDMGKPPEIPGGAALIFTVELLEVTPATAQPGMPGMPGGNMPGLPQASSGGGAPSGNRPTNHPGSNGGGSPTNHPTNHPGPGAQNPGRPSGGPPPPPGKPGGAPVHH
jgi:FKBP-type peptidyl-prolyl cis-trans isomerase FkpA